MVSFKFINKNKTIIFLLFLFMIIHFSKQDNDPPSNDTEIINCTYNNNNENIDDYLNKDDPKQRCFYLSNHFGNKRCCYNSNLSLCFQVDNIEDDDNTKCPKEAIVTNNCGMAGIYQPESSNICNEISLVQGYCCYTTYKIDNDNDAHHACLRTKKLMKEKDKPSEDIINYIKLLGNNNIEIVSVDCGNSKIKYFWIINIIFIILF